jgi:aerobic carbon-monoxide dehydrogenase small subunit
VTAISLTVNGATHEVDVPPRVLLADLLREDLGLTGTKIGCAMGACGACTVLVDGDPVRSCLMFAVQADRRSVRTVEDLAAENGDLHPLQAALGAHHGLQCGYCTPGMLMAVTPLLEYGQPLDPDAVREAIAGNLCRCTGYETVVEAVVEASRR